MILGRCLVPLVATLVPAVTNMAHVACVSVTVGDASNTCFGAAFQHCINNNALRRNWRGPAGLTDASATVTFALRDVVNQCRRRDFQRVYLRERPLSSLHSGSFPSMLQHSWPRACCRLSHTAAVAGFVKFSRPCTAHSTRTRNVFCLT
jgi:hypothetical protein